jgi:hypothetical protein
MRTFIKHSGGGLIDAASVLEISHYVTANLGAEVLVRTPISPADGTAYTVARLTNPDASGGGNGGDAVRASENLLRAICQADAVAKKNGNGALIQFDTEAKQWAVTDLGKHAATPAFT